MTNNIGYISHDEAMIHNFMDEPDYADCYLHTVIADGDIDEIRQVQAWYDEAKLRSNSAAYWDGLLGHAQETARSGYNINHIIERVSKALNILQSALPASSLAQQG